MCNGFFFFLKTVLIRFLPPGFWGCDQQDVKNHYSMDFPGGPEAKTPCS